MRMKKNKKIFVVLLILTLGIGFALISKSYAFNGLANVKANSWNIYFDNIHVKSGSIAASTPTINLSQTTVTYSLEFQKPGDFYEFTVDCVNDGTISAEVATITNSIIDSSLIEYKATYEDGTEIKEGDILYAGDIHTYKIYLAYKTDIEDNDLSNSDIDLNLSFSIEYTKSKAKSLTYGLRYNYDYTGGEQLFKPTKEGVYQLEVWGAQGGSYNNTYYGGYGGYSTGIVHLTENQELFVNVGEMGSICNGMTYRVTTTCLGGYNGGGSAIAYYRNDLNYSYSGTGGGATHIATSSGLLSSLSSNKGSILIVAGGGGGSLYYAADTRGNGHGGSAGGYIGESVTGCGTASGGSQSSGGIYNTCSSKNGSSGSFGIGGNATQNIGTGGGGGYYGGGGSYYSTAAGGSSYIGYNDLSDKVMYCYNCSTSDAELNKTISTTNVSEKPISRYAKIGSGYARISYASTAKNDIFIGKIQKTNQSVAVNNIDVNFSSGKLSFETSLSNTTDYAEFTYIIDFDSTRAFYIDKIKKKKYDEEKISYIVTYSDGTPLQEGDLIEEGQMIVVKVQLLDGNYSIENQKFELLILLKETKKVLIGTTFEYDYSGKVENLTVPAKGRYKLQVWGAQGGTTYGGYGGYAEGIVKLEEDEPIYITVGGQGGDAADRSGGYNGGGSGATSDAYASGSGGGGATHIATSSGLLSSLSENINSILIVAGGGGGTCGNGWNSYRGGSGGGFSGTIGSIYSTHNNEAGGQTKTSRNIFGQGTDATYSTGSFAAEGNGGAGGGYYGGVSSTETGAYTNAAGPGGSGYIGNSNLTDKFMYCYNCTTSNEESTKTISTTNISQNPTNNYAKIGNGYAIITYLGR